MRWSLVLSSFIAFQAALSFVSVALPVLSSFEELESREPGRVVAAKASSKTYRKAALDHPYVYHNSPTRGIQRTRSAKAQLLGIKPPTPRKSDADHIFEHQVYKKVLKDHGLDHKTLPTDLQKSARKILNAPRNMAMIRAGINRGKGSVVKKGLSGQTIAAKEDRNKYTKLSYPEAKRTAMKLDKTFEKHQPGTIDPQNGFTSTLRKTMNSAGILSPNQASPQGSLTASSKTSGSKGGSPDSKKSPDLKQSPDSKKSSSGSPSSQGSPSPAPRTGKK